MSLPKSIKDKEKKKIQETWEEYKNDCVKRMFFKVDEDVLGWNNQIFEDIKLQRLAEKVLKIVSGNYSYEDCIDAANYLMMISMFEKGREEDFVSFPPITSLHKTDNKVRVRVDDDVFVKYLLVYEGINTEFYVSLDDGLYPVMRDPSKDVWNVMEVNNN